MPIEATSLYFTFSEIALPIYEARGRERQRENLAAYSVSRRLVRDLLTEPPASAFLNRAPLVLPPA